MRKYLKFIMFAFISLFVFTAISCSDKDNDEDINETEIGYSKLPSQAQEFISKYFNYTQVLKVDLLKDDDMDIYQVGFEDGSEVTFNSEGEWQQVAAPSRKDIPAGIVPEVISQWLDEYYSGYGVNVINKTGYGYLIELNTEPSLNLMFSPIGQYLGIQN